MTRSQLVAVALNVVNTVIQFLLVTQQDISIPPLLKVVLGASAVGIGVVLTALRIVPSGPTINVPQGDKPVTGG
jgi:heme/copper-type cytochrome/quinol oxidase subunit 4